jgi:hypothetical protein
VLWKVTDEVYQAWDGILDDKGLEKRRVVRTWITYLNMQNSADVSQQNKSKRALKPILSLM